jgi:hypothetical protein
MSLDTKRKELELIKVAAARAEIEFKILEKQEEIERMKQHIETQLKHEAKLKDELSKAK